MPKVVLIVLIMCTSLFSHVQAIQYQADNKMSVERHEIINEDWYASSELLSFYGSALQDVWVLVNKAYFWGVVGHDLNMLANQAEVKGEVGDDVRFIGYKLNAAAKISGSFIFIGRELLLQKENHIGGDLFIAAHKVIIEGVVQGPVVIYADEVVINDATLKDNLTVKAQAIVFGQEASILGDLTYTAPERLEQDASKHVKGTIQWKKMSVMPPQKAWLFKVETWWLLGHLFFKVTLFSGLLVVGLLAVFFLPRQTTVYINTVTQQPLACFGWGLLGVIGIPFLMLFFLVTIIGIPVMLIIGVIYILLLIIAKCGVAIWLGNFLRKPRADKKLKLVLGLVLGLIIIAGLDMIPVLGKLLNVMIAVLGMGSFLVMGTNRPVAVSSTSEPVENKKETLLEEGNFSQNKIEKPSEKKEESDWMPATPHFLKEENPKKTKSVKSRTKKVVKKAVKTTKKVSKLTTKTSAKKISPGPVNKKIKKAVKKKNPAS